MVDLAAGELDRVHERYTPLPVPELTVEEFATVMRTSPLGRHRSANKQNSVKPQPAPPKPPTVRGNSR
jgi:hypothetical protein